jgi:putative ABC transport system ATP-binding protein
VVRIHVRPLSGGRLIELRGVRKVFRQGEARVEALAGVDLAIADGEYVAVVGPSGSGKSTLLNVVGGLERPTAGDVLIDGRPLGGMSDRDLTVFRRRHVGVVFQFFNLLPTLSALENVSLPLVLDGLATRDATARAALALEDVGLASRARHRPDELSGGEMQRVAIARALVIVPKVILADEPTGNLDSRTRDQVLDLVGRLHRERGTTVVVVTHDETAAARAGRIVAMQDGAVVLGC